MQALKDSSVCDLPEGDSAQDLSSCPQRAQWTTIAGLWGETSQLSSRLVPNGHSGTGSGQWHHIPACLGAAIHAEVLVQKLPHPESSARLCSFHPARFDVSPATKWWCSRGPHTLTSLTGSHTLCSASFLQTLLQIYSLLLLPVFPWQPDPISASGIIFMKKFSYSSPVCPRAAHAPPATSPKPSMILQAWIIYTSASPFHCLWWNFSKCINSFIQQGWVRGSPLCWRGGLNFSFSHLSPRKGCAPRHQHTAARTLLTLCATPASFYRPVYSMWSSSDK